MTLPFTLFDMPFAVLISCLAIFFMSALGSTFTQSNPVPFTGVPVPGGLLGAGVKVGTSDGAGEAVTAGDVGLGIEV